MPRLEWSMLAHGFSIDRSTNALSIFNIIEDIAIPANITEAEAGQHVPIGPPFVLLQLWSRSEPAEEALAEARVSIVAPNGAEMGGGAFIIDLKAAARARTVVGMPFLPYVGLGTYQLVTDIRVGESWKRISTMALSVAKQPGP